MQYNYYIGLPIYIFYSSFAVHTANLITAPVFVVLNSDKYTYEYVAYISTFLDMK